MNSLPKNRDKWRGILSMVIGYIKCVEFMEWLRNYKLPKGGLCSVVLIRNETYCVF